ncbi:MAG: cytochrome C oxidase subunit IV family protein [Anaerolineaceae bacterium]|nr:cytochrome C oxidase subunit IV family protein [Anaerolineaceae bacterium]
MSDEHQTPEVHDHLKNETDLFGVKIPLPIYTVIFGVLAVLTVIEVLIGTAEHGSLTIPVLFGIALAKATLVVLFYMHLRNDSRIFAVVLLIPLLMAIIAILFLLIVPPQAYA